KTGLAGMKYLQQQGFIVDTGDKAGQTKQIAIYLLRTPEPHGAGGVEQSQISVETVPKTGHGTSKEPVKEPVKEDKKRVKPAFDASLVELPEWLPFETWSMWVKYRAQAKKPITEDAARLQLRKLEKIRAEGHSPVLVIEAAIENGWQGLFTAKDGSTLATKCPASS
ncbi:hypothetical protein ACVZE1_35080, partial [Pseudomonas aeruginosa]